MIGREPSLALAMALIGSGSSIDVVGGRGSGRSSFLGELQARLEAAEWNVVVVRGVASLRAHPLAAMHIAGIGGPTETRPASIQRAADALAKALQANRSVMFLDDWDDLDESSWGVAESVRRRYGLPIVISRLQGLRARHTPSGLRASTLDPSFVIDMPPIKYDELEQVITDHLGAPVDSGTMSRIYAKSGGVIGLAISIVDAAVREDRMQETNGAWSATRNLWSPGLRGVLEAHLESLDETARDALEMIALVGASDTETIRNLVEWETLEELEQRAMIRFYSSGRRMLATVVPPLLVEYFRHEPLTARRIRLTERIVENMGTTDVDAILAGLTTPPDHVAESDAIFARLLQEQARTHRMIAEAEWTRKPSAATAVACIDALLNSGHAGERIEEVFSRALASDGDGDEENLVRLAILHAEWRAYVSDDLDGALVELAAVVRDFTVFGRLADASAIVLEGSLRSLPEDWADRLEVRDDLPDSVKIALWETQFGVLVALGRFAGARRVFELIRAGDRTLAGLVPGFLYGLLLLGEGDHAGALAWARRGFDEAQATLDLASARLHAWVASLCLTLQGSYDSAEKILATVFAAGDPSPLRLGSHLALLNIAAVVAARRGHGELAERYAHELEALRIPDGPLPGQSRSRSVAQLEAYNGHPEAGASEIWTASEALWERGARFAACTGFLTALEIEPDKARLAVARERTAQVEGEYLAAHLDYLEALDARDPDAMMDVIPRLKKTGRPGYAIGAYQYAETWLRRAGRTGEARAIRAEGTEFMNSLNSREYDTGRYLTTPVRLTDRELEIGRLVTIGQSNREIAAELVVSVRTVESHLHHMTRKIGAKDRQGVKEFVLSLDRTPYGRRQKS
ncbi:LuxR C-terminal-related transcriptional regulator [Diaminobutyricibacter sp. McL0618]|uniref:LuxR C-terminal-related transcriptional regulator n=1 Tax=Leifsonia sp. McL0618 TaxID=3415677 RepID=UPI003CF5750F